MEREEAIKIVRNIYQTDAEKEALQALIPELAESEDERIRKRIIDIIITYYGNPEVEDVKPLINWLEKQKEQKPIIQDVELNDAVYDYVRDHFIAGADFTPEYIKKLMENAFFAGVDYYLLQHESESCEPDTNVEKVIEDVIRVYGKTQGEWVGGYDVDTLIVNLRRAFNEKEQKPMVSYSVNLTELIASEYEGFRTLLKEKGIDYEPQPAYWESTTQLIVDYVKQYLKEQKPAEWSEEDEKMLNLTKTQLRILQSHLSHSHSENMSDMEYSSRMLQIEKCVSWLDIRLESLRPQPKVEWSEEDLEHIKSIIHRTEVYGGNCLYGRAKEDLEWLKNLLNRFLIQPKQEWSEEDEKMRDRIIDILNRTFSV